ncbi:hypothetical protein Bbelb_341450 [Branchiostoma belcheri]|nr:hypothetical protein Bbelb_341450 [Branchiostoma belcheri]
MLRVCEKLREADEKGRRYGLARAETGYLRALVDAMADTDRLAEVELLKTLGDVNLEEGRLGKDVGKFNTALALYLAAFVRCSHREQGEGIEHRYHYTERLLQGVSRRGGCKNRSSPDWLGGGKGSQGKEQSTQDREMTTPANVARKFQDLDMKWTAGGDTNIDSVLVGYAQLMVERIVNDNNLLETEAIKSLGDVCLRRGTETGDTRNLTKASALYNRALARCNNVHGTVVIVHRLLHTAKIRQDIVTTNIKFLSVHTEFDTFATTERRESAEGPLLSLLRSYRRYIQTAGRDLQNGDPKAAEQNLAAALKLVHDPSTSKPNMAKEADCLRTLGDVYVALGKLTGEGRKFTQAAALYNASMARKDGDKQIMIAQLQETERQFLVCVCNLNCEPCPYNSTLGHISILTNMRARAKSQLETIHQEHNPYQYDEDDPVVREVEIKRAEAIKNLFKCITVERQQFIQGLTDECIEQLGPPPCKFAFIGLGSQATELVTPYSDLEFAILIEEGKDDDDTQRYFLNLTHFLHFKVINLGETMAIPSLNDFLSEDPEKSWFFDSVTPRGFAFDGFMPWASKTPFGRDKTKTKPSISLIQTPAKLAEYQHLQIALSEGYHLSDILRRVTYLTGDVSLVDDYVDRVNKSFDRSPVLSRLSANLILKDIGQVAKVEPTGQLLDVKKEIYSFPSIAIDVLSICCGLTIPSVWGMIEELQKAQRICHDDAHHLTVLISISAELRLRTYIANGGQKDRLSPLTKVKVQQDIHGIDDTYAKSVFYVPDSKMLFSELGDRRKAIRYYEQSLKMMKVIYGESTAHPGIASSLNNIGLCWHYLGDQRKAIRFYEQSLRMRKAIYGKTTAHLDIAASFNNIGACWVMLGDQRKAVWHYKQSLKMFKTIYGETTEHPAIASSFNNIGACWSNLGDQRKAFRYYEQSLKMTKAIYGETTEHPAIANSLNNIGNCWHDLDDQMKAIGYYEQSLEMRKAIYGEITEHPDIASSLNNIGNCWGELGDQRKAMGYYEQSLKMRKAIYGETTPHPDIALSLNNIGNCWGDLGDQRKAIRYYVHSYNMSKAIYGETTEHPDIASSLNNIGNRWGMLGDHRKAIRYHEQSLKMRKAVYGENANALYPTAVQKNYSSEESRFFCSSSKKCSHGGVVAFAVGRTTILMPFEADCDRTMQPCGVVWRSGRVRDSELRVPGYNDGAHVRTCSSTTRVRFDPGHKIGGMSGLEPGTSRFRVAHSAATPHDPTLSTEYKAGILNLLDVNTGSVLSLTTMDYPCLEPARCPALTLTDTTSSCTKAPNSNGYPKGTICTFACRSGCVRDSGARERECKIRPIRWAGGRGLECLCNPCSTTPSHPEGYPRDCKGSSAPYPAGHTCTFACPENHYQIGGDEEILCNNGEWKGTDLVCEFDDCHSDPCENGGTCTDGLDTYTCECTPGWTGDNCTVDVDECITNNGGCEHTCTNNVGSFECSCDDGYVLNADGLNCDDVDECTPYNGGCEQICIDLDGAWECDCHPGYVLNANETNCDDVNECESDNGGCEHNCTNTVGSFVCSCDVGYALSGDGLACDDVDECVTDNGGCDQNCTNNDGSFACSCDDGYTLNVNGLNCDDIDECGTDNGGCAHTCANTDGSFECSCNAGYALNGDGLACDDVDECETGNGGCADSCDNTVGSFTCSCGDVGYQLNVDGLACDDVNECDTDNGGCDQTCENTDGSFECSCGDGYTLNGDGLNCDDINECDTDNGGCAQTCTNNVGSFECSCDDGYVLNLDGLDCDDVDECLTNNGGCNQNCTNNVGSFECSCGDGYVLNGDGLACDDVDECNTDNGGCNQTCTNTVGSFECSCGDGYTLNVDGLACDDIDECATDNGGCNQNCTNNDGSFECSCGEGYTLNVDGLACDEHLEGPGRTRKEPPGRTASYHTGRNTRIERNRGPDIDECDTDNGGCAQMCTNNVGSFECSCNAGYVLNADGMSCDDVNECDTDNGGCDQNCTNNVGSFECSCNAGYALNVDGLACDDVNECESDNGGCDQNCTNTVGSFECSCDDGYALNDDGLACDDVNECDTDNGGCDQNCTNTEGSFECSCTMSGYVLNADGFLCDLDGQWSAWGEWSACSESCGDGTQMRSRSCDDPEPVNDGDYCVGHDNETQSCNEGACAVDGQWSTWLSWSNCNTTCGDGTQIRTRYCDNPWPANGGTDCLGEPEESQSCNNGDCPVNGQWSAWSGWSDCSTTCGNGVQERMRTCDTPAPANGGLDCVGLSTEQQQCDSGDCV